MKNLRNQVVVAASAAAVLAVSATCMWRYSFPALNCADADTIARTVYGIGPTRAAAIVAEQERGGDFRDWDDLDRRMDGKDVGPVLIENIRRTMRLGGTR